MNRIGIIRAIGVDVWKPINGLVFFNSTVEDANLAMESKIDNQHYLFSKILAEDKSLIMESKIDNEHYFAGEISAEIRLMSRIILD